MAHRVEIFRILSMQHREVYAMLSMLAVARAAQKRALLVVLEQQLLAHVRAEERTFYPAVRGAGDKIAVKEIGEAEREHQEIGSTLTELMSLDIDDDRWDEALRTLAEQVQQHVKEEESVVFDLARQVLDEAALQMLAEDFRKERKQELQSLGAPDDDYATLTKEQLLEEARQRALAALPSMTKEQLIAILRAGY